MYIYQKNKWPQFEWDQQPIADLLLNIRYKQGKLLGRMEGLGFTIKSEANLENLTLDILKSSEIEGEVLNADQVRSSIARKLGLDIAGLVPTDRNVEGIVEMMLDATQNYQLPLSDTRLFGWQAALFPTGYSGRHKIVTGNWRDNTEDDPMQVVSGPIGREMVHFRAPAADLLEKEMKAFLEWFNSKTTIDDLIKAAIAHLWFVTIHPFDDGNGRIARAISDMQLSRADESAQRFYSMSAQIRKERKAYYDILEATQKGSLDITQWLRWFLECLNRALDTTSQSLATVLGKSNFWEQHATTILNKRQHLMLNKLLDGFEGKLNTSKWAKIAKTSHDSALRDIQDLIEKGILIKEESGGRSTSYSLTDIK